MQPALYAPAPLLFLPSPPFLAWLTLSPQAEQLSANRSNKNWGEKFVFDAISLSLF